MFFFVAAMVLGFARLPAAGPVSDDLRSLLEGCGRRRGLDYLARAVNCGCGQCEKKALALGPREVNRRSRLFSVKP